MLYIRGEDYLEEAEYIAYMDKYRRSPCLGCSLAETMNKLLEIDTGSWVGIVTHSLQKTHSYQDLMLGEFTLFHWVLTLFLFSRRTVVCGLGKSQNS